MYVHSYFSRSMVFFTYTVVLLSLQIFIYSPRLIPYIFYLIYLTLLFTCVTQSLVSTHKFSNKFSLYRPVSWLTDGTVSWLTDGTVSSLSCSIQFNIIYMLFTKYLEVRTGKMLSCLYIFTVRTNYMFGKWLIHFPHIVCLYFHVLWRFTVIAFFQVVLACGGLYSKIPTRMLHFIGFWAWEKQTLLVV